MALIHSILMGAVAGMRAMTPLATVTADTPRPVRLLRLSAFGTA